MTNENEKPTYLTAERLRLKARKKHLSNAVALGLVRYSNWVVDHGGEAPPLSRKYRQTFGCCDTLDVHDDGEIKSLFYCQNRWCNTCASIKMATMINQYLPEFQRLPDLQFVTLTLRSVYTPAEIRPRLELMQNAWRRVADNARRRRDGFIGLRKTELKVGKGGGYHGHYHIIISGADNAAWLVGQWLTQFPDLARPSAQDFRPVRDTETALLELFKYSVKCTAADDTDNQIIASPLQMDAIFTALYRRRLYQPFGGLRMVDEDRFDVSPELAKKASGYYQWLGSDWWHREWGQPLTGYTPDDLDLAINSWK